MSSNSSANGGLTDSLVPVIVISAVIFGLWFLIRTPLTNFLLQVSPPAFSLAVDHMPKILLGDETRMSMANLAVKIPSMNHKKIVKEKPWKITVRLISNWGYIFRPILVPVFLILAIIWIQQIPARLRHVGALKLMELANINAEKFPCLYPAIKAEVWKRDLFVGTWKLPLTTFEWVMTNGLLIYKKGEVNELKIPAQGVDFVRLTTKKRRQLHAKDLAGLKEAVTQRNKNLKEGQYPIDISGLSEFFESYKYFSVDEIACDALLRKQLGAPWRGVDKLPDLERALAVSLMSIICGGPLKKRGKEMLNQISRTFVQAAEDKNYNIIGRSSADLTGLNELYIDVQKHVEYKRYIVPLISSHHYISTVMMRLLSRQHGGARDRGGKLTPVMFHWLKPHNEALWRVLDKVDAQRPWVEGIAAFTHYHNEIRLRQAISTPVIEGGTASIVRQLHREEWITDDELSRQEEVERQAVLDMLRKADESGKANSSNGSPRRKA